MNSKLEDLVVEWRAEADRLEGQVKILTKDQVKVVVNRYSPGYRSTYEAELKERARTLRKAAMDLNSVLLAQRLQALKDKHQVWNLEEFNG
jgi:hypothetical protein